MLLNGNQIQLPNNVLQTGRFVTIGLGAIILAPILIPAVARASKPLVKVAIKSGILLYENSKGAIAEATEVIQDMVAEAKVEFDSSRQNSSDS